ncbi:sensor domain-containing diguanylate cyclase [Shewanella sp. Choline-02u-19]|jgi:diguanylate cyclase (GGDEF)-like protein|uniref:sensor domain-containing diguanylate cyclase n=1 Tax=unclassified Shewanella TaxID=196818 RepID=UPI000C332C6E|nr:MULTISPECIES: sensor domain-containing diguanylate cyclase [unclassified Shewanella]PKG56881.1 sensor domain-containing diguanylate cyclase [Shewanella sp. GutDb-MelDb]PKH57752.1 sensor domain-containing diguanylate cyclase [Shewanella sp. Bg11-22]PKI29829.1 sensor domain-containing diguanylate cyclase [Shewanella sp. Choline-02u-19]
MTSNAVFNTDTFLLENPNDLISLDKWQKTVNLLAKLFDAPAGFLVQYTPKGFQVTIASAQASNPYPAGVIIEPEVNIFCRRIVETRQELYVNNAIIDSCWDNNPEVHSDGFRSYLGVPVFWPCGEPFGTFCVMDYKETNYKTTYLELIRHLKDILESDLSLIGGYADMQKLAITDPLSGVHNRRGFNVLAEQRIKLAHRTKTTLGLLYLDVDNFKAINDQHGHGIGDDVITLIGRVLTQSVRQSDVIGRIGGDEFVALVMLDETEDLQAVKHRIAAAFCSHHQMVKLPVFTVSIGITEANSASTISELLDVADKDMLQRKRLLA